MMSTNAALRANERAPRIPLPSRPRRPGRPFRLKPAGKADLNLYAYVGADPINQTDPSGLAPRKPPVTCTGTRIASACGGGGIANGLSGFSSAGVGGQAAAGAPAKDISNQDKGAPKNVQQSTTTVPSLTFASGPVLPGPWTFDKFMSHYFTGNGETLDLRDMGLGKLFESTSSVQNITSSYMSSIMGHPEKDFWVAQKEIGHTDVTAVIFSLGKSAFYAAGGCHGSDCLFRFSINDAYEDPLALGVEMPLGAPYRITYEWTVSAKRGGW